MPSLRYRIYAVISGEPLFIASVAGPAGIFAIPPKKLTSTPLRDISRSATSATNFPELNLSNSKGIVFSL